MHNSSSGYDVIDRFVFAYEVVYVDVVILWPRINDVISKTSYNEIYKSR